jgi:hypothetical protein
VRTSVGIGVYTAAGVLIARGPKTRREKGREEGVVNLVKQTYRILLTRGMKGCYMFFEKAGTKDYFQSRMRAEEPWSVSALRCSAMVRAWRSCFRPPLLWKLQKVITRPHSDRPSVIK